VAIRGLLGVQPYARSKEEEALTFVEHSKLHTSEDEIVQNQQAEFWT
jgi:hypothetical protein